MNKQENQAAEFAARFIHQTNRNVFLTGKAGTGKTTFLRSIIRETYKNTIIGAPTGIAAINAGGVTLHSLFHLPFGAYVPATTTAFHQQARFFDAQQLIRNLQMNETKRRLLREMELLVIDEVSMLRADLLDAIDVILRFVRRENNAPFGGVQVLFIGDLMQLPPVVKEEEWNVLKQYYKSSHFFEARILQNNKPLYLELDKIYRQGDNRFIELLNNLRNNTVTENDIQLLNAHYQPGFNHSPSDGYITLTTHNYKADRINTEFLNQLNEKEFRYTAKIDGDFNEFAYPVEKTLVLKKGAQIMFLKNDTSGEQRYYNGKTGRVVALSDAKIEVSFEDGKPPISVEPYVWKNIKFQLNPNDGAIEEHVVGTFTHFPIKLAWAITVHKSQGLTFEKAIIDIEKAFAPGQVYVALSRLTGLEGMILSSPVKTDSLQSDQNVLQYAEKKEKLEELNPVIEEASEEFLRSTIQSAFNFSEINFQVNQHLESYTAKDQKRSAKLKYKKEITKIVQPVYALKSSADGVLGKIRKAQSDKQETDQTLLQEIKNTIPQLLAELKNRSLETIALLEKLKTEKKIKAYWNELIALEQLFFVKGKQLNKLEQFLLSKEEGKQLTKADVNEKSFWPEREEAFFNLLNKEVVAEEIAEEKTKAVKEKAEKVDTKEQSLNLFNEGKSIEEIATLRGYTVSTIEGHLAHYVSRNELDVLDLITKEKYNKICDTIREEGKFELKHLKEKLGENYSYGEIRLGLAGYLASE